MKRWISQLIRKSLELAKWVWRECKDWHTFALFCAVSAVLSAPIWLGYLLGFIFRWEWAILGATAIWGFFLLPGAPFILPAVAITLGIKRLWQRIRRKSRERRARREQRRSLSEPTDDP